MSSIDDFNRIDDCEKIDAACVNAYVDFKLDPDSDTGICLETSWGGACLDLTSVVKAAETCTSLYLSPENGPNCLVYEGECDNYCIHGDDLSRIISMAKLKDVDQSKAIGNGDVYMYSNGQFTPFNLSGFIDDTNTSINNINAAITNLGNRMASIEGRMTSVEGRVTAIEGDITSIKNRLQAIEAKLTPPSDAPNDVGVVFGNINLYSDPNVVISEGSGTVTSLDKNHGLYTHRLSENKFADEIFG